MVDTASSKTKVSFLGGFRILTPLGVRQLDNSFKAHSIREISNSESENDSYCMHNLLTESLFAIMFFTFIFKILRYTIKERVMIGEM